MRILSFAVACPLLASLAFAQLDPYTLTVTATRSISMQPDQASLNVYVDADPGVGLNDILSLVQGVGLTQANLGSVYSVSPGSAQTQAFEWAFSLTVPYASLKSTLSQLGTLQSAQVKSGFMVTFQVTGTQVSPQLQASQTCPTAALISDATTQAQALSQAAGLGLGSISSMSDGSIGTVGASPTAAFAEIEPVLGFNTFSGRPSSNPIVCTAVVKFKLVQI